MKRLMLFAALLVSGNPAGFAQNGDDMNTPAATPYNPELSISRQPENAWDYEVILPLAQAGDARAQVMLAMMYLSGMAEIPDEWDDDKLAQEVGALLQAAAAQGDAEGQYYLAYFYKKAGFGEHDYVKAAEWFRAAALQNHSDAQLELAKLYANDDNIDRALMWLYVAKRSNNFEDKESYESKYRRFVYQTKLDPATLHVRQRAQAEAAATRCYRSGYMQCD